MGNFAVSVAISHQIGTARNDRTMLSAMDISREEFFANFGRSINELILSHRLDLEKKRKMTRLPTEPKMRWVDNTPEYSLYICALRKLFPRALFIHMVRDVTEVVRSLLNFFPEGSQRLVDDEQAAYEYWLRRATACAEAEQAYWPEIIYRMRYVDLISQPEYTMRRLLDFLGERYAAECLEPLAERINTANMPADFDERESGTNRKTVEQARQLSEQLQSSPQPREASREVAARLDAEFERQVEYHATLDAKLNEATRLMRHLQEPGERPSTLSAAGQV
jgi:hypothetical protein